MGLSVLDDLNSIGNWPGMNIAEGVLRPTEAICYVEER